MTALRLRSGKLNITAAAADGQRKFRIVAYTGGKLNIEGFPVPVVCDLQGLQVRDGLPILIDHKNSTATTLGQVAEYDNDGRRLIIAGPITGDSPECQSVLRQSDAGHQWEASIGAVSDRADMTPVEAGQTVEVNGQTLTGPFLLAHSSLLRETSVLPMGADATTSVNLAAKAAGLIMKGARMPTFDEYVTGLGLDPATLTEEAKTALMASYKLAYPDPANEPPEGGDGTGIVLPVDAEGGTNVNNDPNKLATQAAAGLNIKAGGATGKPLDAVALENQRLAANYERIQQIQARCAGHESVIKAAIAQNWSPDQAELHMLRQKNRQQAPYGHVRSHDTSCTLQAMQGAMILRAGGRLDHPAYTTPLGLAMNLPAWMRAGINTDARQQAMEAAWRYRDLSMVDMAREALRLDGKDIPLDRSSMIRAAFGGGSLGAIFTNNVNTIVLATYADEQDSTVGWTQEEEVADFKVNERPRMEKIARLTKHVRGGTADTADRAAVLESFKIARFSQQWGVDEMDMIDDTFGALKDTPAEFGGAAKRLRPDLVYAILLANPQLAYTGRALFNVTEGNLGSSSALAAPTLKAAISAMFLIQENGVNLGLEATHLVLPPTLEFLGYELLQSAAIVIAGTAGSVTERGSLNSLQRKQIEVVADSRLENGVIDPDTDETHGGSSSTWFLASNKAPTITVAYRRGTGRAPQVRSWTYDRDGRFGMGWDIAHDVGAAPMDWRGLRKTTA